MGLLKIFCNEKKYFVMKKNLFIILLILFIIIDFLIKNDKHDDQTLCYKCLKQRILQKHKHSCERLNFYNCLTKYHI